MTRDEKPGVDWNQISGIFGAITALCGAITAVVTLASRMRDDVRKENERRSVSSEQDKEKQ